MYQLADKSRLKFLNCCGPEGAFCLLPETRHECLVTSCVADVGEITPKGHLGRSEQHGLFDCPRGSVEVAHEHEVGMEQMSNIRHGFDHVRDVLLTDGPFEEGARFPLSVAMRKYQLVAN